MGLVEGISAEVDSGGSGFTQELDTDYPLTHEQVESLHERGWAYLPGLLTRELVDEIRRHLQSQELRAADAAVSSYSRGRERLAEHDGKDKEHKNPNISHEAMAWRDEFLKMVATSRRVAGSAVRLMMQPDALLAQDISFLKPAGGGRSPLHQDYSYYPFDRRGEVSLWITLTDMSEDMGPLHYLEGSHHEGPLGLDTGVDIRETYPHLRARKIVAGNALSAGDAQAHWDLTIHGAAPNTTENDRAAYTVRYIRSDTIYSGVGHPHFDKFNLIPGKPFAESNVFPRVGAEGLLEK